MSISARTRTPRAKPGNPSLAIAYLRVSTEDQRLGPEAQRAQIETWAARERVAIGAWHLDQGVSGGADLDNRLGLIAALGELRAIGAGVLVVAKRDRLARDVGVAAAIERATEASGARVQSADGTGNGAEASDAFMRTIIDAAAAYERALIRARTKAALAAKKARGELAGNAPFGYRVVGGAPAAMGAGGKRAARLIELDPREQAALDLARQLRSGGRSLRAITRELAARGVVGRTGQPLKLAALARVLGRTEPAGPGQAPAPTA